MKKLVSFLISLIIIVSSLSCGLTALADDNTNLMLGATFSANNAYYNGWYPDNRPLSKLNDGNTYVGVGYNGGNVATIPMEADGTGYVNADFGSATTLNKVIIYFAGTSAGVTAENVTRDFAIDVKLEDGTWKRVAEQHLDAWTNWDAKKVTLCFDAVDVTDVCLKIKNHASSAIYEIEAFYDSTLTSANNTPIVSKDYTADAIPMPEYTNLLPSTTITANSEHYDGWYNIERPISRLIDGEKYISYNAGKLMVTPYGTNGQACINFAFGSATFVNKVVVYLPGTSNGVPTTNQVTDYAIDALLEDGNWVRVAEKHADPYEKWDYYSHEFYFDAVKCVNLRLTSINADGQTSASFFEIEAYNINTQTSDSNTPIDCKDYTTKAIPNIVTNNLAPSASLTANAEHYDGWYNYNRPISSLIDGQTFVGVGYNVGQTFISPYAANGYAYANLKFSKPTTINKIVVYFPGYNAVAVENQIREYAVDVRDADGVWTRVAKQNNAERSHWDAYSDTLIFDAVECVQVRITCVNTCGQSSMGIYEIEAYNVNTLTKADNTALEDGTNIDVPDVPASVDWAEDVAEPQDYAYSFALVGDTQIVTKNDVLNGTNDLDNMYQYIIDKKDDYKIAQVIGLGDIVDTYADGEQKENEWKVATSAISKLDDVLPYTLVSGNHDINWNFNYRVASGLPNYINQSQVISKYGKAEAGEATDEPSVANTAHEFTVNGVDYLIVTIEYAAHSTLGVMDWANKVIKNHPHHNVIITTHAYLSDNGDILDGTNNGSPSSYSGCENHNNGDYFWDNLVSKHENISMVICGHVGTENIVKSTKVGDKGNTVTQIMVNTQDLDADIGSTGTVAFLYFSEDGKNVQVRQYSTVRDRYLGSNSQTSFTVDTARAPIQGDINNDAKVNILDIIRFKKYFAQFDDAWIDPYTSDLDGDGSFDTLDLTELRKMLLSK